MSVGIVTCTHCQSPLRVPDTTPAGKKFRCPRCRGIFVAAIQPLPAERADGPTPARQAAPRPAAERRPSKTKSLRQPEFDDADEDEPLEAVPASGASKWPLGLILGLGAGAAAVLAAGTLGLIFLRVPKPAADLEPRAVASSPEASLEPVSVPANAGNLPAAAAANGAPPAAPASSWERRGDYIILAEMIADPYSLDPLKPTSDQPPLARGELDGRMKTIQNSPNAIVQAAVKHIQAGLARAKEAVAKAKDFADRAKENLRDVQDRANRGGYEYDEVTYENGQEVSRFRRDSSGLPLMLAWANAQAASDVQGRSRGGVLAAMEDARLAAWTEIVPRLGEVYGSVASQPSMVEIQITRPEPRVGGKPAVCALVNKSGRTLTNVTVVADFVYLTNVPNPSARYVCFLRRWPADQTIYLSTSHLVFLLARTAASNRPTRGDHSHLMGVGGVVETRLAAWAMEGHQPETAVKYPDVAAEGAQFTLEKLSEMAEREIVRLSQRGPRGIRHAAPLLIPADFQGNPGHPPQATIEPLVRRIQRLAPNSDLSRQAQAYLDDPIGLIRNRRQRDLDRLVQAAAAGRKWSGEWVFERVEPKSSLSSSLAIVGAPAVEFEMPGTGSPPLTPALVELANQRQGTRGPVALSFESFTALQAQAGLPPTARRGMAQPMTQLPNRGAFMAAASQGRPVTLWLYVPGRKETARLLVGQIVSDDPSNQIIIDIVTHHSKPGPVNLAARATPVGPLSAEIDTADLEIKLYADADGLRGTAHAIGDKYWRHYRFALSLQAAKK